jgi:hypothetical protein
MRARPGQKLTGPAHRTARSHWRRDFTADPNTVYSVIENANPAGGDREASRRRWLKGSHGRRGDAVMFRSDDAKDVAAGPAARLRDCARWSGGTCRTAAGRGTAEADEAAAAATSTAASLLLLRPGPRRSEQQGTHLRPQCWRVAEHGRRRDLVRPAPMGTTTSLGSIPATASTCSSDTTTA